MGCTSSIAKNSVLTSKSKEIIEELNKVDGIKQKKEITNINYMNSIYDVNAKN
jgi:hypothetical protein